MIAQALPVFDNKFAFAFFFTLKQNDITETVSIAQKQTLICSCDCVFQSTADYLTGLYR